MPGRVLVMDTSVLCCLLEVPGKDTCGSGEERWDKDRIDALLAEEENSILVLPLASIVETGNHIAQAPGDRFNVASRLAKYIAASANAQSPWAAFTEQAELWDTDRLKILAEKWPALAAASTTIGDATIADVAEFYARAGYQVEIVTGDAGLKAYEPRDKPMVPRRRQ